MVSGNWIFNWIQFYLIIYIECSFILGKTITNLPASKDLEKDFGKNSHNFSHVNTQLIPLQIESKTSRKSIQYSQKEITGAHAKKRTIRKKRNIVDFNANPSKKWTMPIHYKIDTPTISIENQVIILASIEDWQSQTCMEFVQLAETDAHSSPHLIFTDDDSGCSSNTGMSTDTIPQPIYLDESCFEKRGTVLHHIGHALGLYDTQVRSDRDLYVDVIAANIKTGEETNYNIPSDGVSTFNFPYDYGSIMHAAATENSVDEVSPAYTILPKNRKYISTLGQRSQLSFYDIKTVNEAYCSGTCIITLPCQNEGYPDPNDCTQCICPAEWSGQYCDSMPVGSPTCFPESNVYTYTEASIGVEEAIFSPGYWDRPFIPGEQCFWYLKGPPSTRFMFWFSDAFDIFGFAHGLYQDGTSCMFWVELKSPGESQGERLCGSSMIPTGDLYYSDSNEVYVIFLSFANVQPDPIPITSDSLPLIRGFELHYVIESVPAPSPISTESMHPTTVQTTDITSILTTTRDDTTTYSETTSASPILTTTDSQTSNSPILTTTDSKTILTSLILTTSDSKTKSTSLILTTSDSETTSISPILTTTNSETTSTSLILTTSDSETASTSPILTTTAYETTSTSSILTTTAAQTTSTLPIFSTHHSETTVPTTEVASTNDETTSGIISTEPVKMLTTQPETTTVEITTTVHPATTNVIRTTSKGETTRKTPVNYETTTVDITSTDRDTTPVVTSTLEYGIDTSIDLTTTNAGTSSKEIVTTVGLTTSVKELVSTQNDVVATTTDTGLIEGSSTIYQTSYIPSLIQTMSTPNSMTGQGQTSIQYESTSVEISTYKQEMSSIEQSTSVVPTITPDDVSSSRSVKFTMSEPTTTKEIISEKRSISVKSTTTDAKTSLAQVTSQPFLDKLSTSKGGKESTDPESTTSLKEITKKDEHESRTTTPNKIITMNNVTPKQKTEDSAVTVITTLTTGDGDDNREGKVTSVAVSNSNIFSTSARFELGTEDNMDGGVTKEPQTTRRLTENVVSITSERGRMFELTDKVEQTVVTTDSKTTMSKPEQTSSPIEESTNISPGFNTTDTTTVDGGNITTISSHKDNFILGISIGSILVMGSCVISVLFICYIRMAAGRYIRDDDSDYHDEENVAYILNPKRMVEVTIFEYG